MTMKASLTCAALALTLTPGLHAALITNGDFEAGLTGWVRADQIGSEGTFFLQTGTSSPVNLLPVPPPPQGTRAAMTDAEGPGSHVLYQDFVVPGSVPSAFAQFSLFINNTAPDFFVPAHLDFASTGADRLNQQVRIDLLTPGSDPFSVNPGDILQNLYMTQAGAPLVSGYTPFSVDVTSVLQAHLGQTLRLRFAAVDNVSIMNVGIDAVDIDTAAIPEPGSWALMIGGIGALAFARSRVRRSRAG